MRNAAPKNTNPNRPGGAGHGRPVEVAAPAAPGPPELPTELAPELPAEPGLELATSRLLLRPPQPSDRGAMADAVAELLDTNDTTSGVRLGGESVEGVVRRQLHLAAAGVRTRACLRRAIFPRDPNTHSGNASTGHAGGVGGRPILGCCNLITIERGLEWYAELAFWLRPSARGRGYAAEACRAVVDHALADLPHGLGLWRIDAYAQPDNAPARATLASVGFCPVEAPRTHLTVGDATRAHELWRITSP